MPRARCRGRSSFLPRIFFADIPAGDSNDGRFPADTWFFNNSTINMTVPDDVTATVPVKEAGMYHLFVRSDRDADELVPSGDRRQARIPGIYGKGPLAWTQGGDFTLKPGMAEIQLTAITPRPSLNVLVLTKNAELQGRRSEGAGASAEVKLLHEYKIAPSNIVKFGDVDGTGKYAIVDILNDYSTIVYANDGHELWRWMAPPTTRDDPRGE